MSGAGDGSSVGGSCCHVASSSFFVSNEFQELWNDTFTWQNGFQYTYLITRSGQYDRFNHDERFFECAESIVFYHERNWALEDISLELPLLIILLEVLQLTPPRSSPRRYISLQLPYSLYLTISLTKLCKHFLGGRFSHVRSKTCGQNGPLSHPDHDSVHVPVALKNFVTLDRGKTPIFWVTIVVTIRILESRSLAKFVPSLHGRRIEDGRWKQAQTSGLRKGGEGWMENGVEILLVDGSSSMDSGIVLGCFENEPSNWPKSYPSLPFFSPFCFFPASFPGEAKFIARLKLLRLHFTRHRLYLVFTPPIASNAPLSPV